VKYSITRYALILLLVPLFILNVGCEITPEDQWPVITSWDVSANYDVTLTIVKPYGIPQLTVPDRNIKITVDVRTYNASQAWDARIFLESVDQVYTQYENNLPGSQYQTTLPVTENYRIEGVAGDYVANSGKPPQGVVELVLNWAPQFFPLSVNDWLIYSTDQTTGGLVVDKISDRYVYRFRVILFDQGGRSDSFTFDVYSILKVASSSNT
jgi:hypothetical protein